jgi:hypothetical protein
MGTSETLALAEGKSAAENYFNTLVDGAENNKLYSFIKAE